MLATERNTESLDGMLGFVYNHLPDHDRSLAHSRRALERVGGRGTAQEAALLNNIGFALQEEGQYAQALEHYRRSLTIGEKALGPDHPEVAVRLSNIGSALQAQGQYAQALEHYRRAMTIDEKALGPDHPEVAMDLNNIGSALQAQGQYAQALEHYRRALATFEKALGPEHPSSKTVSENLALCRAKQSGFVSDAGKRGAKNPRGVVVLRCLPGCQGLEAGDWFLAYNNTPLEGVEQLKVLLKAVPPESPVTLTVVRNGKKQTLTARGGKLEAKLH